MTQEQPSTWRSQAGPFLHREVARLPQEPGLRSLPEGPERDFVQKTWGPIVYRTTYAPDSERLFPLFVRAMNDEIKKALPKRLEGPPSQMRLLEETYSSKVFSDRDRLANVDEGAVRDAFLDWKRFLGIPVGGAAGELPVRLKMCLMVDDGCLAAFARVLDQQSSMEAEANYSECPVKVVEDMYGQRAQLNYQYPEDYPGWTTVTFSSFVEMYDSMLQGKRLSTFFKKGQIYKGNGKWIPT